jgi:hypothetical protein
MAYSDRDRVAAWLIVGHGEKLTTLDRCILVTIAERANKASGLSAPGVDELARYWGVLSDSVIRSIRRLHRFGLLDTVARGRGQHRARYVLTGEVARPTGQASSPTEILSSPTEIASRPTGGSPVLSESSRSSNGVRTTPEEDAPPRAPDGALRRGQEHAGKEQPGTIPADTITHVAEVLKMRTDEATAWAESKLDGHAVRNVDKYIRRCVETYSPPKPKSAASNGSTRNSEPQWHCDRCGQPFVPWHAKGITQDTPNVRIGNLPVLLADLFDRDDGVYYHPDGQCPPTPGTRCDEHWQEQPCTGCAADRKARKDEPKPTGIRVIENIARIVRAEAVPADDLDDGRNQQVEVTRAGLAFGAYTNLPAQDITIWSDHDLDIPDEASQWPEGEPLPDEPFRSRAIKAGDYGSTWEYRPHDAVEVAEAWQEQTDRAVFLSPAPTRTEAVT